jgi:hypothetical protein
MSILEGIWAFLQDPIYQIILIVVGAVIGDLVINTYYRTKDRPKIIIKPYTDPKKAGLWGFSVNVVKNHVENAKVYCNKIKYQWEDENGNKKEEIDLVSGMPSPKLWLYQYDYEYKEEKGTAINGSLQLIIKEIATKKTVYTLSFPITKPLSSEKNKKVIQLININEPLEFKAKIRIIGFGIEEEKDYVMTAFFKELNVALTDEGKPRMDFISGVFRLKMKKRFGLF